MSHEIAVSTHSNIKELCQHMYIYKITNNINNKIYIGKTINDIKKRFSCHKSNAKSNKNTILCKAIRKYRPENFSISIIEKNIISESVLNEKEIY